MSNEHACRVVHDQWMTLILLILHVLLVPVTKCPIMTMQFCMPFSCLRCDHLASVKDI